MATYILVIEVPVDKEALGLLTPRETVELDIVTNAGKLSGYQGKVVDIEEAEEC